MSLAPPTPRGALALADLKSAVENLRNIAIRHFPECYQQKPEVRTVTVQRQKLNEQGQPFDPPQFEDVQVPETVMVYDLAAAQQFFDEAEAVFPGGGMALCFGLLTLGVSAQHVLRIDSATTLPPAVQQAVGAFMAAAQTLRDAAAQAGLEEQIPVTPPFNLIPSPVAIAVQPKITP